MKLYRSYLELMAANCGPTFYLLDSTKFQSNFSKLNSAFRAHYANTTIAYSYKTNYVPRYCQIIEQLGGCAEVVSSMEMMLALKIGVPAHRIYFNGPYKDHEQAQKLLCMGGTVNIDSLDELQLIISAANSHQGEPFKVGLRCNFDVQDGVLSRFGFDVKDSVFTRAVELIDLHPKLRLVGLHCHFAKRSLDCWKHRTCGMLSVIDKHFSNRLEDLDHVSLGGGMYGCMEIDFAKQFPFTIPKFENYAEASAKLFAEYFLSKSIAHRPTLIIEPGTALVADAMKYVCRVFSIKKVRGRTIVTLTGSSYNINPNPSRKNLPIELFTDPEATDRERVNEAIFVGYTCVESDCLHKNFSGELAVGDFVIFSYVGSYSVVMKPPFIMPNVAILEPTSNKHWTVIKRQENFEDVFLTYNFKKNHVKQSHEKDVHVLHEHNLPHVQPY